MGGDGNIMKNYFKFEESALMPGSYLITLKDEFFEKEGVKYFDNVTGGSFLVLQARLLGLSFPTYLRFCRDVLGATLIGKGNRYPVPVFKKEESVQQLLKLLNSALSYAMKEHEFPYDLYVTLNGEVVKSEG